MNEISQQLVNGLALGAVYALIAIGYTMVYGVLRFINFAHGDVFMLGSFTGYFVAPQVARLLPLPSWGGWLVVMLITMVVCAIIGIVIELLAYRPLRDRPRLTVLITAIGVSLLIQYTCQHKAVFGASQKAFPKLLPTGNFTMFGLSFNTTQFVVLGVTVVLLAILTFVVKKTRIGMAMRAVSHNASAASLMGISNSFIISFTFGLGSALAGAGGILYGMTYTGIEPLMGVNVGLKAFVAAVLGGIGNLPGAALGGLVLGVVETYAGGMSGVSTYRDGIAFAILIIILIFKPTGLLGTKQIEKV
ncbi:MAG: branched-chain amino acid ABC transporter permease [Gloeobacteraceae cyanobacterium ES-bin-144]|nr:branched-chain amino acid ABC transporter permease [Verrucomicrobiales bacterium]